MFEIRYTSSAIYICGGVVLWQTSFQLTVHIICGYGVGGLQCTAHFIERKIQKVMKSILYAAGIL